MCAETQTNYTGFTDSFTDGLGAAPPLCFQPPVRSENRRTLTVGSSESEVDSSAKSESTSSFAPWRARWAPREGSDPNISDLAI